MLLLVSFFASIVLFFEGAMKAREGGLDAEMPPPLIVRV